LDVKLKKIWWLILGILLVAAAVKFMLPVKSSANLEQVQSSREIVVYVTGAVQNPGIFHLPLDSRLDDLLKKAVLTIEADKEALNPAQKLKDGQKIVVPFQASTTSAIEDNQGQSIIKSGSTSDSGKITGNTGAKVNINTAGAAELDTLPGIGPAIAQRIIDYREQNGLFSSPEDLQNVSGIGPKTYEKMAENITIGP